MYYMWLELKTSPLTPCGLQCTNWERPPDVLSNQKLVISIQLTAERDSSTCFHDHKVGRVPNNVHIGKQGFVCGAGHTVILCLTGRGPSCTCGFSGTFVFTPQLHTYHMMPSVRKLTRKYTGTIISIFLKYYRMK